jgi:hypothetical protein
MPSFVRALSAALCALLVFAAAHAQPPPATLDKAARTAVVEAAAKALKDGYVFPDVGRKAGQAIQDALAAGSYEGITEPEAFAERLTTDLAAVAHDKHLRVSALGGPPPAGPPPLRSESGVVRSDLLAGNIGYIEIIGFPGVDVFREPLDRAMAGLAGTRALIIDARRHHGGSPDAEAYLAGYLLSKGAAPVVADRFIWRTQGTEEFTTQNFSTSPTPFSYAGKPVYVLTSHETFSGGEALAYGLQALHLATIVGETTGGGANPGGGAMLGPGFAMFLPRGRSNNPVTGTNWEGVGVRPDIKTPAADALKVALQRLGRKPAAGDIETLSQARLFTPRSLPQPASEAAVRRIIGENQRGEPDYSLQLASVAAATRAQLPQLKAMFSQLGQLESVIFVEVDPNGYDIYDARFASGAQRISIVLTADGKVADIGARRPPPPAAPAPPPT